MINLKCGGSSCKLTLISGMVCKSNGYHECHLGSVFRILPPTPRLSSWCIDSQLRHRGYGFFVRNIGPQVLHKREADE